MQAGQAVPNSTSQRGPDQDRGHEQVGVSSFSRSVSALGPPSDTGRAGLGLNILIKMGFLCFTLLYLVPGEEKAVGN